MRILVKFPTRERPERFKAVLEGWVRNASNLSRIDWLLSLDRDDKTMNDLSFFEAPPNLFVHWGTSVSKVDAINRDIGCHSADNPWDVLLVLSDDMVCVQPNWDAYIRANMEAYLPDGDGLMWFFDGKQKDICTLPLMGRKYYDRFGYVYRDCYKSVFADDEQTAVARDMGKLVFFDMVLAEHHHPANFSHVKPDPLYLKNETHAIWKRDEETYFTRKAQGFPQ